MGNNHPNSSSAPSSPSQSTNRRENLPSKQIHISTNHPDGFYFTGERLSGTVKIPISFLRRHVSKQSNLNPSDFIYKRSLRSAIVVDLIGDATYSAQVDVAADSDGHATHRVNLCRQRSIVSINQSKVDVDLAGAMVFNGTFQLLISDGLPPSLPNNRTPSIVYTLELSLSSSRDRYQIPLTLSSRGSIPHPLNDVPIEHFLINEHQIRLNASLTRSFYRPGEQLVVHIDYLNPQQRCIRAIRVRLVQFYRIHNEQYRSQLDGKEWKFDVSTMFCQNQWSGEARLQLPEKPLAASFPSTFVGTTQSIEFALDYRLLIELYEKKGDDIILALPSFYVTYEK